MELLTARGEGSAWLSMLVSWQERLGQLQDRRQWLRTFGAKAGAGQQRRALKTEIPLPTTAAGLPSGGAGREEKQHCCRAGSKRTREKRGHWPLFFVELSGEGGVLLPRMPGWAPSWGSKDPEILATRTCRQHHAFGHAKAHLARGQVSHHHGQLAFESSGL